MTGSARQGRVRGWLGTSGTWESMSKPGAELPSVTPNREHGPGGRAQDAPDFVGIERAMGLGKVSTSSQLRYHRGMTTMEILVAKAKALPPEGQREVLDFVEFLETRLGRGTPHKSLSGAWSDLGVDLSAEDIDQVRREA